MNHATLGSVARGIVITLPTSIPKVDGFIMVFFFTVTIIIVTVLKHPLLIPEYCWYGSAWPRYAKIWDLMLMCLEWERHYVQLWIFVANIKNDPNLPRISKHHLSKKPEFFATILVYKRDWFWYRNHWARLCRFNKTESGPSLKNDGRGAVDETLKLGVYAVAPLFFYWQPYVSDDVRCHFGQTIVHREHHRPPADELPVLLSY